MCNLLILESNSHCVEVMMKRKQIVIESSIMDESSSRLVMIYWHAFHHLTTVSCHIDLSQSL